VSPSSKGAIEKGSTSLDAQPSDDLVQEDGHMTGNSRFISLANRRVHTSQQQKGSRFQNYNAQQTDTQ
jgi:hypothetical protein